MLSTSKSTRSRNTSKHAWVWVSHPSVPILTWDPMRWRYAALRHTLQTFCSQRRLNCVFSERMPLMKSHAQTCLSNCCDMSGGASVSSSCLALASLIPTPAETAAKINFIISGTMNKRMVWPLPIPLMRKVPCSPPHPTPTARSDIGGIIQNTGLCHLRVVPKCHVLTQSDHSTRIQSLLDIHTRCVYLLQN